jgi:hypothetical protein
MNFTIINNTQYKINNTLTGSDLTNGLLTTITNLSVIDPKGEGYFDNAVDTDQKI